MFNDRNLKIKLKLDLQWRKKLCTPAMRNSHGSALTTLLNTQGYSPQPSLSQESPHFSLGLGP